MSTYNITWLKFDHSQISLFQDPTYESYIPKEEFFLIYEELLQTFDGSDMCSYIDLFFKASPINKTIFEYVDEDARTDFREMAEEMNLIPPLKEISEGESKKDKEERNRKASEEIKRREKRSKLVAKKSQLPSPPRLEFVAKEIDRILKLLEKETDPKIREKLTQKLDKAIKISQKTN